MRITGDVNWHVLILHVVIGDSDSIVYVVVSSYDYSRLEKKKEEGEGSRWLKGEVV